jgi:hypothetical protein
MNSWRSAATVGGMAHVLTELSVRRTLSINILGSSGALFAVKGPTI